MAVRVHPETGRPETPDERADRNLNELLAELRVALPGVQVLFAFLLVVPFNPRYPRVSPFDEKVYFVTLVCTAVASVLLIAPTVHHRIAFRQQDKEALVVRSNRLALAGLFFLGLALIGAMLLVTDFIFGTAQTVVVTAIAALLIGVVWYALPLRRRLKA